MKEKRETLTQMLLALMEQKDARQNELKSRLNELEKHKSEETDNYWLIQYQKLLDSKPKVSVTEIERTHVNRQGYKLRLYTILRCYQKQYEIFHGNCVAPFSYWPWNSIVQRKL